MDSDFHYYGTGTAALQAGFNNTEATTIANVAQYVDWFDSDYWSYWRMVDHWGIPVKDSNGKQYRYEYPQLSVQKIDWKMAVDYDKNIWNAFHFPPGNLPYAGPSSGWQKNFQLHHVVRNTNLSTADANKLCRPFSQFALDMINDTVSKYRLIRNKSGPELAAIISNWVAPRVRCPVTDGAKLALYLLGVRMHILSDTWAHQDFTGEGNYNINGAGRQNYVFAKDAQGNYQQTTWTGTIWALHDDTDCAAAPNTGTDNTAAGHGQMGHYPDYSWLTFKYPAAWLPKGTEYLERENPGQYNQAWSWINFVMGLCSGQNNDTHIPKETPADIVDVMATWHRLSTTRLEAVPASEALWRSQTAARQMPYRWDPETRKPLGLYDGLATTRYGYINVVQDSTLHCMETAAAIHYQFCVDWLKANPNYSWVPWQPKT